jgi:UDP-N-acetylglucosamine 2-epimerase (non-hydrolysing)
MSLPTLHLVACARPNLPKLAAVWRALHEAEPFCVPRLLHTGQHHDDRLFAAHLDDLGMPRPHIALGIAGGSHAELTGRTMIACEAAWRAERPDLVVVAGDVDGTLAAALAARKLRIPVAHLEAGLRGTDRDMAEEINRRAVDAISDILWAATEEDAAALVASGHEAARVRAVGNSMADTLLHMIPRAGGRALPEGLPAGGYGVLTLHRAENVDSRERLAAWLEAAGRAAARLRLAWPLHPRTRLRMESFGLSPPPGVLVLPPLGYLDFAALLTRAALVATDSGGVQEEATVLDIPCLTLREGTERPVTLREGSSRLVAPSALPGAVEEALSGRWPRARPVRLWDGEVGRRVCAHLREILA